MIYDFNLNIMNDNIQNVTENFRKDTNHEVSRMLELLRRVYNTIEMSHLNDHKLIPTYTKDIKFPRSLGEDIFNYLQSKDQIFRNITIKRQKIYRKKKKDGNTSGVYRKIISRPSFTRSPKA